MHEAQAADEKARLTRVASHWMLLSLSAGGIERARHPFRLNPSVLASGLVARLTVPDNRVRACAEPLGFIAATDADPATDPHASSEYRRKMVKVFVRRALLRAAEDVRGTGDGKT
jgi:hypothetical protein